MERSWTPAAGAAAVAAARRPVAGGAGRTGTILALQRTAGNRCVTAAVGRRLPVAPRAVPAPRPATTVQRHASWEHKLLSDVEPSVLEVIASGRDAASADSKTVAVQGKTISTETVAHALDQEIRRIEYFRNHAPAGAGEADAAKLAALDRSDRRKEALTIADEAGRKAALEAVEDTTWNVRLIAIPLRDKTKAVLTYGEVATLEDIYGGGPEEIKATDPENFRAIVAGIRTESLRKLMYLRNEVAPESRFQTAGGKTYVTKRYSPGSSSVDFEGAIGNTGTGVMIGELGLMGKFGMTGKSALPGRPDTEYQSDLARNACHFAPHSWHVWAEYHQKAIGLAKQAFEARQAGKGAEAETLQNEALLQSAYGDHFLQDSFSAGHLINKTLIMQWFAKWLDAHPGKSDMTSNAKWRSAQNMAYGQEGLAARDLYTKKVGTAKATDPQTAENTKGAWTDRFAAAGLSVPPWMGDASSVTYRVFRWWQYAAAADSHWKVMDLRDLKEHAPVKDEEVLKRVLRDLHDKAGVIRYETYETDDRYLGVNNVGFYNFLGAAKNFEIRDEFVPRSKERLQGKGSGAYVRMAQAATHKDYTTFMTNSYLQLATSVLHDDFCVNGLTVSDASGANTFLLYGDNNMLKAGSAKGVRWQADTSRMSQDAVYGTIATGTEPAGKALADIDARLPRKATANKNGKPLGLADWHGEFGQLWQYCDQVSFPDATAFFSKGTLTGGADMGAVSRDNPHSGEGF